MAEGQTPGTASGQALLYLTDEQLRQGIEAMFFAYRGFTADPDRILEGMSYGRAHHRAIHFIRHRPDITVAGLIEMLGVTKQSLNRVLRQLIDDGLVLQQVGEKDRRQRLLTLSDEGAELEAQLSQPQRDRLRQAYTSAGPEAVAGFREVLHMMMNDGTKALVAETPGKK